MEVMSDFQDWCALHGVVRAIDGTHFDIKRPSIGAEDYYYFKSGGFSMQFQAVVDRHKRFLDVSVGMLGSTNDMRVLRRSSLYHLATTTNQLFNVAYSQEGFSPYLIGDKGYPMYPWLMMPYRDLPTGNRSIQERFFNRKLSTGRCAVENAFGILKQSFRELGHLSELHVTALPDVVVACCLLHNMLLNQHPNDVAFLIEVLQREGMASKVDDDRLVEPPLPAHRLRTTTVLNKNGWSSPVSSPAKEIYFKA